MALSYVLDRVADGRFQILEAGGAGPWPAQRAPLPPDPQSRSSQPPAPESGCWAGALPYVKELPYTPPKPDTPESADFLRGNFQLQIPGLTEGFNDKDRSLLITWELVAISEAAQRLSLTWFVTGCGYRDLVLSVPQTKNLGKGLNDLIAICLLAQSMGCRIILNVLGGDGENFTTDVAPWLEALLTAGVKFRICIAWQIDAANKVYSDGRPYTQALVDITLEVSAWAKPRGIDLMQHWENDACALWPYPEHGIANRFDYGRFMVGIVKFQLFQCNTEADIGNVQEGLLKVRQGHPQGTYVIPTEYETQAIAGYPNDPDQVWSGPKRRLELYGDQKGLYCCCVTDHGFLGGARLKSGLSL
jgi:hypothetical protein